ncbi:hypothetical protein [Erwinia amylovora]
MFGGDEYAGPVSYTHLDVYKRQAYSDDFLNIMFGGDEYAGHPS